MRQEGNRMREGLVDKYKNKDLTWLVEGLGKVLSSGARMDLTTEGEHPTSVVLGGCVAALPRSTRGKTKTLKGNFWENLTVQILQSRTTGSVRHSPPDSCLSLYPQNRKLLHKDLV